MASMKPSSCRFIFPLRGPLLGRSWGPLGPSWKLLGPSWGPHAPSRHPLLGLRGRRRAIFGASWADWERRETEKATTRRSFKRLWKINEFCILGPSCASWSDLSATRGPLGPSGGPLVALLARLGNLLVPKESRGSSDTPQEARRDPGNLRILVPGNSKILRRTEARGIEQGTSWHGGG